jgi:hypothetical protein
VYEYVDITPARYTTITEAVISFTVPVSWLEENHISPQNVVMNHQVEKTWTALPTTLVKTENGKAYYTAVSPGFSRFAVTGGTNSSGVVNDQTQNNPNYGDLVQATTAPIISTVANTLVTQQTTTAPPAQPMNQPTSGFPVIIIGVVGIIVIVVGAFLVRLWWIRRQNPALYKKLD